MNILLMTGTIRPQVKIEYSDTETRYNEYMKNIKRYISKSDFDIIIFAENSGYYFDTKELQKLSLEHNKTFEYLNLYEEDNRDSNISVGDARIIQRAIEKSNYIKKEERIWKVSGRIWIRNVNEILEKDKNCGQNVFLYAPKYNSIQTWFFSANIHDLQTYFLSAQALELMEESCIEYVFMEMFDKHKEIKISPFKVYPDAEGINSSGMPYTISSLKLLLKNIALWLGYYTVKKNME